MQALQSEALQTQILAGSAAGIFAATYWASGIQGAVGLGFSMVYGLLHF